MLLGDPLFGRERQGASLGLFFNRLGERSATVQRCTSTTHAFESCTRVEQAHDDGLSGLFRAAVHAAAENTSTFATITGHAPMMAP